MWPVTKTSPGVSLAPVNLAFSMGCFPSSKLWGCKMHSGTCIPTLEGSHTQPPQGHHQPGLTDGLSLIACSQSSAQQQSQTSSLPTTMGSPCLFRQLMHPLAALAFGPCHPASSHMRPSRLSCQLRSRPSWWPARSAQMLAGQSGGISLCNFLGYRGDVHSFLASSLQGRQTNLRCARTTA